MIILKKAYSPFCFIILFIFISLAARPQSFSFRKVNSGTRAKIQSVFICRDNSAYFFTDRIYRLENNFWEKIGFLKTDQISCFYPVSAGDFWFTVDEIISTSIIYHYHRGIIEKMNTPFVNHTNMVYAISPAKSIFSGYGEMAVWENDSFRLLPFLPAYYYYNRFYAADVNKFWCSTVNGELFLCRDGVFERKLPDRYVRDFCFSDPDNGFVVTDDGLYQVGKSGILLIHPDVNMQYVNKMHLYKKETVIMVGDSGLFMTWSGGKISRLDLGCREKLTGIASSDAGEIWICGEDGCLLYQGNRQFPPYIESHNGFVTDKLINFSINLDDEYGVAMADFNGDHKPDIYAVRIFEKNKLYINHIAAPDKLVTNRMFNEETIRLNALGSLNTRSENDPNELKLGVAAADVDNDGDQDLYICYLNTKNRLLLNGGRGYFRNVSVQSNRACENMHRSNAAAFADVDNDRDLDLFVTNEEGSNRLFINDGTGHFADITGSSGLASERGGMCTSFADVNSDGLPDLCVTFWNLPNKLYLNESDGERIHFREVKGPGGISQEPVAKSNGVAFADVNNDGFPDLFIANRNSGNKLYLNDGSGNFTDKTGEYFEPASYMSNGVVFADFDLDGFTDLYLTNVGGNVLYKNQEGRRFTDMTSEFSAELGGYCTGSAAGDVDNDGDPDFYVANYINGNSQLFLNITARKTFVKIKLHGVRSNRDAVGAKVWLYKTKSGALAGYREINAGNGYGSTSEKEMIFGVDSMEEYYALVKFPSSHDTLKLNTIRAGAMLDISESKGLKAFYTLARSSIVRFFSDRENQPEIIKYSLIILLLVLFNPRHRRILRNIGTVRWTSNFVIFLVFVFFNTLFLFRWPSVSFFYAPAIALGWLAFAHLLIERVLLKRQMQHEKVELREKLSRDLHDDLASTLGSVSIYADTMKKMDGTSSAEFRKLSTKIAGLTQTALHSVSDIIWMTSPRNDSLQSLVSKTNNYCFEILTDNHIGFQSDIRIPNDPVILSEGIRNNLFLILKEATNNIIRHARARNVEFNVVAEGSFCSVSLKDDGVGIAFSQQPKGGSHGNGLVNMRRRAGESGMDFKIGSPEQGTEILIRFKI